MAKRKRRYYAPRRRRRYLPRLRAWRRKKKTVPFETFVAATAIPFTPAATGFASPFDCIKIGNMGGIADSLKCGFLGFKPLKGTNQLDLTRLINPLDMEVGRYTKMLIYASLIGMLRKRISRSSSVLLQKIPIIGRWIS